MIHTTRQNLHFATQLRLALTFTGVDMQEVYESCGLTDVAFRRLAHGLPTEGWHRVVAWFTYGPGARTTWPVEEWLWDATFEKLWPPVPGGAASAPTHYLQTLCRQRKLFLWELALQIKTARRGPVPKRLGEMYRGNWIPSGLSLIPVLGLTLRIPIRPFLPRAWPA